MIAMTRDQAIAYIKQQTPAAFLKPAKKHGWVCPVCGNGTGKDGDGIVRNPRDGRYTCFKCGDVGGDILDLIGFTFGLKDFNEQLAKACEIYGVTIDRSAARTPTSTVTTVTTTGAGADSKQPEATIQTSDDKDKADKAAVEAYLAKCHAAVGQTTYFADRGITQDSIDRFNLGYDPAYDEHNVGAHPWQAAIIPTADGSFEARNIAVEADDSEHGADKYRKHGPARIFNADVLSSEKDRPIFVCEGVMDAISIIQSGGQAIALGSTVNGKLLLEALDKIAPAKPLVIAFDSDEMGKQHAAKLAAELDKRKVPHCIVSDDFYGEAQAHDANQMLVYSPDYLALAVNTASWKAEGVAIDPAENYQQKSAGHAIGALRDAIKAMAARKHLMTYVSAEMDKALGGGLYPGLYVLGAISSLGKTTLALQIADNLALQGQDVLFFSLEQSRFDLMTKSISRESYMYCRDNKLDMTLAKSNLGVMDGRRWGKYSADETATINKAFDLYAEYADHVYIVEGLGSISVQDIRDRVRAHITWTDNKHPVVFIDYLQILKPSEGDERATDKQVVDHNITALKQLSRDFDIIVIAISSLNRLSYKDPVTMSAFKESGSIEYGSDVLIGLQLQGVGKQDFDPDAAKAENPRHIDLRILKNRNDQIKPDGVPLVYYPAYNCFVGAKEDKADDYGAREDEKEDQEISPATVFNTMRRYYIQTSLDAPSK